MGLISSLLNWGASAHSSAMAYQYQKKLAEHQYQLTRKLNQNAYQDTTYSMREAGINPMLAINNGATTMSANTPAFSVSTPQNDFDFLQGYSTAKQLKNETKRVENETELAKSTVKKNDYESDLAHENSSYINEQTRLLQQYGGLERQQNLLNSAKQGALLDAQRADVQNQILNRNIATNSAVQLNLANQKYTNERSRGYSDSHSESLGGFSVHGTHTRSRTW